MTAQPIDALSLRALRLERRGAVLRVTIDHPESDLNAVDELLHDELTAVFGALRRESEARAVLLTGHGRAFSAGGDFRWFPKLRGLEALDALRRDAKQLVWDLLDVEIPIVAALNGHAVGLGASIALLCDVIFMADTATIADPHVRVGIVAGDGGVAIWPLLVGPARAKQYLLTGDPVSAAEAERIGLVNRTLPHEELLPFAREYARELAASCSPASMAVMKRQVYTRLHSELGPAFEESVELMVESFGRPDFKEGVQSYLEKRPPRFPRIKVPGA
jgi:enoyl-CoA hydratase